MNNEIKTWLFDILQSINEIDSYYLDKPKLYEAYQNDIKTKRAIERNLEIIGEAVNRIRKSDSQINLENADKIVATRNRIIHGYDSVSDDLVWSIVLNSLPKLKENVNNLLNEGF
ncbi:DUF86 domain-containing protein [Paucihalobacter ruber]|jgi:uncharacterized protein with HEPN domain|uniref:DUF86 domain-containing protein n=1 Tax=Paucihalobacter ruber TaxID=2567861 RepID=A0A506PNX6_9FLAO|nr:HepT-like ribonuclease domain-containing protein [Paucihalobacter ruber]TPV34992.1 DUF86 domain-containing protein [Paucihalobacter ruber]